MVYDLQGNINTLKREQAGTTGNTIVYLLTYAYQGNQLKAVTDAGQKDTGFKDSQTLATEYLYDPNGNFLLTGKEKDEFTLWSDFGARPYDAQLARWHNMDALSEKFLEESPYSYVGKDPINYVDLDGQERLRPLETAYHSGKINRAEYMRGVKARESKLGAAMEGGWMARSA